MDIGEQIGRETFWPTLKSVGHHVHYCMKDGHEWLCHGIACAIAPKLLCEKHR